MPQGIRTYRVESPQQGIQIISATAVTGALGVVSSVSCPGSAATIDGTYDGYNHIVTPDRFVVKYRLRFGVNPASVTSRNQHTALAGTAIYSDILAAGGTVDGLPGVAMVPAEYGTTYVDFYAVASAAQASRALLAPAKFQHAAPHRGTTAWNTLAQIAAATSETTLVALANALKALWNEHCASAASASTGVGAHHAADATNTNDAAAATDFASAYTLLNQFGYDSHTEDLHAHSNSTTFHSVAVAVDMATFAQATTPATGYALANELKTRVLTHCANAHAFRISSSYPSTLLPTSSLIRLFAIVQV